MRKRVETYRWLIYVLMAAIYFFVYGKFHGERSLAGYMELQRVRHG